MNIFIRLFLTFFKVGAFGFGGGYGILSLMQEEMVHNQAWLTTVSYTHLDVYKRQVT